MRRENPFLSIKIIMTTSKIPPPKDRFFNNLMLFKDILDAGVKRTKSMITPELIDLAFQLVESVDRDQIITNFIERTHPLWPEMVEGRNMDKILHNSFDLFDGLGEERVDEIVRLVTVNHQKGGEDVDKAWKLLESLVRISLKYIHEQRVPVTGKDGLFYYNNPSFLQEVDLDNYAKKYKLVLTW